MYKDKEKQKEANRMSAKIYRLKKKGMTVGYDDSKGMTQPNVIPSIADMIKKKLAGPNRVQHHPTCKCGICSMEK